jgi:hypothetical protein
MGLFKTAAKALARSDNEDVQQQPRRKSGETDKALGRHDLRAYRAAERGQPGGRYDGVKAAKQAGAAARGRFAKLRPAKAEPKAAPEPLSAAADTYARACLSLSNTLDWQALWQANANNDWQAGDFSATQDQFFPQP